MVDELTGGEGGGHELHAVDDRIKTTLQQLNQVLAGVATAADGFGVETAELLLADVAVVALQLLLGHQLQTEVRRLLAALTMLAGAILTAVDRALGAAPEVDAQTAVDLILGLLTLAHTIIAFSTVCCPNRSCRFQTTADGALPHARPPSWEEAPHYTDGESKVKYCRPELTGKGHEIHRRNQSSPDPTDDSSGEVHDCHSCHYANR